MPKVRLNYDGWLALPASIRQKLGLATGTELEVELAEGVIVLRPARQAGAVATVPAEEPAPAAPQDETATPGPEPDATAAPVVKRGPGRPRKTPAVADPAPAKARGRRAAAPAAE